MRIVIGHDTVNTTSTSSSGPLVESGAQYGGRACIPVGASEQRAAESAGGPPQWLLDAVKQAMEKEDSAAGVTTDALDGGAAST